jgi:aspartate kinase
VLKNMKEQNIQISNEVLFKKQIVVMKFGGSSLAGADRICHAARIVRDYTKVSPVVVVVSAMQGVTDILYDIYNAVYLNNVSQAEQHMRYLGELHIGVAKSLAINETNFSGIESAIRKFNYDVLRYFRHGYSHISDKDTIVSYGERLSPLLFAAALSKYGIHSQAVDAASVITTDNQYGNAIVNLERSQIIARQKLGLLIGANSLPVIGGFYGISEEGRLSILGRGGSDYSAAALAHVLNAKELVLWKEVDGVFSADPKFESSAVLYQKLTYDEAISLSSNGAKILHPEAMKPVAEKHIPVYVKNYFRPELPGTIICEAICPPGR